MPPFQTDAGNPPENPVGPKKKEWSCDSLSLPIHP